MVEDQLIQVESARISGRYEVECFDRDGNLKWRDHIDNLITTEGKNYLLECGLAASALTTVGPFMGLISSVTYSTIVVADTMASHAGWKEAGSTNAPTFAARITLAGSFGAAASGSKASGTITFTMTGAGTLKGLFVVTGSGAVATLMSTAGTLLSAGLFTGGDKVVANTDIINTTFTATLT